MKLGFISTLNNSKWDCTQFEDFLEIYQLLPSRIILGVSSVDFGKVHHAIETKLTILVKIEYKLPRFLKRNHDIYGFYK